MSADPRTAIGDPLTSWLGFHWRDEDTLAVEVAPHLMNPGGRVLGPVGFTLVDYSMGATLFREITEDEGIATINIAINYMDSATAGEIRCTSTLDRRTRSNAALRSEVRHEDGRLLYTALGTFAIFRRRP